MPKLQPNDLSDVNFVDALELQSSGSGDIYSGSIAILHTQAVGNKVIVSGWDIINDGDQDLQVGDIFVLSGSFSGSADGTYHVLSIINTATFSTSETLINSTGGLGTFKYQAGAANVGINSSSMAGYVTSSNVQQALQGLYNAHAAVIPFGASFPSGSIVFISASGTFATDKSQLFWDDPNNRLGIGTPSPDATLYVMGSFTQHGSGSIDMQPSGSFQVRSRGAMALDPSSSLDLGSLNCTGIKMGDQNSIGVIYFTYLGQSGLIYGSNLPSGSGGIAHYFYSTQLLTGSDYAFSVYNQANELFSINPKGDIEFRRPVPDLGTTLTSASFAFSTGSWGVGAAISSIQGTDTRFSFTMTAGTTARGANPSVILTFKDGAYANAPYAQVTLVSASAGAADMRDGIGVTTTTTSVTMVYGNTPGSGAVYKFVGHVIG